MSTVSQFRLAVSAAVATEFAAELQGRPVEEQPLATDAGSQGVMAAVYADGWQERPADVNTREVTLNAVLHDHYGDYLGDGSSNASAALVEGYSDRMCAALKAIQTSVAWYIRVRRVEYFNDPSGERTRFRCVVTGWDDNPYSF